MGYYSTFSDVTVETGDYDKNKAILDELWEARDELEGLQAFGENCKGYDATFDLCKFSLRHPDALFSFDRTGEEAGDLTQTYVKNGKYAELEAVITFPEFDESMLTSPIPSPF